MSATATAERPRHLHDPSIRGYHAIYRQQEINRCPGCGRSHWYIGRASAECGFCATALPFATAEFATQRSLGWR